MKYIYRKCEFILYLRLIVSDWHNIYPFNNLYFSLINYCKWKRSRNSIFKLDISSIPWMNFPAIHFLKRNLDRGMVLFEYGSGGSTIFFLRRNLKLYSVEHNSDWFNLISSFIDNNGIKRDNFEYRLIQPVPIDRIEASKLEASNPFHNYTSNPEYSNFSFTKYVEEISKYPDEYFDLVVVDGRSRASCIRASANKVKIGGYILLDNSERFEYLQNNYFLKLWKQYNFSGPVIGLTHCHKTTFFKRVQ